MITGASFSVMCIAWHAVRTRITELLGNRASDRAGADGLHRPGPARVGGLERRRARHHRDVVGPARRGARRDRARCATLTDKPFGVNIAQLFVRDPSIVDFVAENGVTFVTTSAGDPTKYTDGAEGRRPHGVPRRAVAARRAEGGRRRCRRARRRGQRGRRVQGADRRVDDGAAAADRVARRRADHRRRRRVRRPVDGRRVRARRRGRADGHAHGERGRVAGARQLEAAHLHVERGRHAAAQPALAARVPRAAHRVQRGAPSARTGR